MRVAVFGAAGRMGGEVCRAVTEADDLALVATVDPAGAGAAIAGTTAVASAEELDASGVDVGIDFTQPDAVMANARWCLINGVHVVIGTTGLAQGHVDELRDLAERGDANAIVAPNFAIGAVLMMRFAEEAARHLDAAEVIELHHDGKKDAPSGTAIATARRIAAARPGAWRPPAGDDAHPGARGADVDGVRVHGVRLPGLLAHQEVILGGPGQTLTIRHDSTDRASFMPGVLLAVRAVASRPGLTVGLEPLLDA
ncbi:MAG TPA: 4-hydroxy-tetrahydrodipicolinate reductase [Actinomycetota bacterium]|nr:4-hydroxy-tetrahydrodipicolinate reductase [Actinomycetota bacterium]